MANPSVFNPWLNVALLLATGTLLGLSTNLSKLAHGAGVSPIAYLFWSVLGAAIVLAVRSLRKGRVPPLGSNIAVYAFVAALLSVAVPNLLFFSAVPHVGASFVALAIAFPPLLTYAGALALGMERYCPIRAAGVIVALTGAAWIAWLKLATPEAPTLWIAAALIGPVFLALGNIFRTLRWPAGVAADDLAPGMLAAAAAILLVASLWPGATLHVPVTYSALMVIGAQVATFALQFLLYFRLQKSGGPVYISLLGAVGAMTGVPFAIALLGDNAPAGLFVGGLLIAGGIALLTSAAARPATPQAGLSPAPQLMK